LVFLYNLGNILILLSLSFRKIIFIRMFYLLADLCFISYGLAIGVMPLVYWAICTLGINSVQVAGLIRDMVPKALNSELRQIKELFFASMSNRDFLKLIKLSSNGTASHKKILVEGQSVRNLFLITKGHVYFDTREFPKELGPYHFIGEMSYFGNGTANITIEAKEQVDYLFWRYSDLRRLQVKEPQLFMKMLEAMGKDVILKMLHPV
jgi:hypothetical protein